jgi:hypothetical protein
MWHYAALLYPICTNNLLFYNFKCKLEVKAPSKKKKKKKKKRKKRERRKFNSQFVDIKT